MKRIAVLVLAIQGAGAAESSEAVRVVHEFRGAERSPSSALTSDGRGNLYGTTFYGGAADRGTLYTIRPDGTAYRVLHEFAGGGNDGAGPVGALVSDSSGRLYGVTTAGGGLDRGTVFRIHEDGGGFEVLHSFVSSPWQASLVLGDDGSLYGVAPAGIFRVGADGVGFEILHSFVGGPEDGRSPLGPLVVEGGVIHGATAAGGQAVVSYPKYGYYFDGDGTVFSLRTDGTGFRILQRFVGAPPVGGLASDGRGALYGLTSTAAFRTDTGGNVSILSTLPEGAGRSHGPPLLSHGELFGETTEGLFRMKIDGTSFVLLHHWLGPLDGSQSSGLSLLEDGTTLLRATTDGGAARAGALSRIDTDGSGFAVLHTFPGYRDAGRYPMGLVATSGALYGIAEEGGAFSKGLVYRVGKDGSGFTVLHAFGGGPGDGEHPNGAIALDTLGRIYGSTTLGGREGAGVLFRCGIDGSDFRVLHSFAPDPSGGFPAATRLLASSGRLYGTTEGGGAHGAATLFSIDADGNDYRVLREFPFDPTSGRTGYVAGLAIDSTGILYGAAVGEVGGTTGAIFSMRSDGTQFRELYRFPSDSSYGSYPRALVLAKPGVLVGVTLGGGDFGSGALFRIGTDGTNYRILHSISFAEAGTELWPTLVVRDGVVWGETFRGGTYGDGTIFQVSPDGPFRIVRRFGPGSPDGDAPGGIVLAADGELFGTSWSTSLGRKDAIFAIPDGLARPATGGGPGAIRRP